MKTTRPVSRALWAFAGILFAVAAAVSGCAGTAASSGPLIRVLVWDERQPQQKPAYPDWLGNTIAEHLKAAGGMLVTSVALDDPSQGLGGLDNCDVLVWWGHQRHQEIKLETAKDIVRRIESGKLSLIALHSAHWSRPFVEAMNTRARADALASLPPAERITASMIEKSLFPGGNKPPAYTDLRTPSLLYRKRPDGPVELQLTLPNCCFPAYRADGKPSQVRVLLADHPVVHGLPQRFEIEQTEMYDEPFHVPPPDDVVIEERWASGEWFRSGCVWKVGKGRVFYFRPGHEIYPVFKNPHVLKLIENAVRWLGRRPE